MGHFHSSDFGQRPGFTPSGTLQMNLEFYKLLYEAGGRERPYGSEGTNGPEGAEGAEGA